MASVVSIERLKHFPAIVWTMIIGGFFVRGAYYMVWPFLAVILYKKFNLSASTVGLILTATTVVSVILGVYIGNLSDRLGRRVLMLLSTLIGIIAFYLLSVAQSLEWFITAIFLATLPRTFWDSPSKAMMADALPEDKDRELGFQASYFMVNVGAAIGPLFGVWAGLNGQQSSFVFTAFAYFALMIALLLVFRSVKHKHILQQKSHHSFRQTLQLLATDQVFLLFIIASSFIMFVYAQIDSSLVQYLTRANAPELVSLISSIIVLNSSVIIALQFVLLKWMENMAVRTRINIAVVLLAISQLYFAFNPVGNYFGWLVGTFILSVAEAILFPNMNIQIDQLAPSHLRGSYFGAASLYSLGVAFAPLMGGIILDTLSGPALFLITTCLCALVLVLYYWSKSVKRPDFAEIDLALKQ